MLGRRLDDDSTPRLNDLHVKNQILIRQYHQHRSAGAESNLCSLFMKRLDSFFSAYLSSTATPAALGMLIEQMERDFNSIDCFADSLRVLKSELGTLPSDTKFSNYLARQLTSTNKTSLLAVGQPADDLR